MLDFRRGRVVNVAYRLAGDELVAPLAEGDTLMLVDDVDPFDEAGGEVRIAETVYAYSGVDEDASALILAEAAAVEQPELALVIVLPETPEKTAYIIQDDEGESVPARIPHMLDPLMAEGVRDPDAQESVQLITDDDDELVIFDILGRPKVIDGSSIDPETLPRPGTSDGDAPSESPAPSTLAGLRQVFVKWDGVPNADLVRYEVHISGSPIEGLPAPVAGDPATLAVTTGATLVSLSALADGTPLQYDATYSIAVIATDVDGAAPASAWVPGVIDRTASGDIVAGAVTAAHLEAVMVLASRLEVGEHISIEPPTDDGAGNLGGGFVLRDPADPTGEPLVRLHPSLVRIRGEFIADFLTIMQDLTVQNSMRLASKATQVIENGVSDPPAGPAWNTSPLEKAWADPVAGSYVQRGIAWGDDVFWRLLVPKAGSPEGRCVVHQVRPDGSRGASITLGKTNANSSIEADRFYSIVQLGDYLYSPMREAGGRNRWRVAKWRKSNGAFVDRGEAYDDVSGVPALTSLGADELRLFFLYRFSSDDPLSLMQHVVDPSDLSTRSRRRRLHSDPQLPSEVLTGAAVGPGGDFGTPTQQGNAIYVSSAEKVFVFNDGDDGWEDAKHREAKYDFTMPASAFGNGGGFCWDGSAFQSTHGDRIRYQYSGYYPDAGEKFWGRYADTSGGKSTAASPVTSVAVPARHVGTVTLRPAPSGVTGAKVWVGYGSSQPSTYYQRSESLTRRTMILTRSKDTTGSTELPASNELGGSPALVKSDIGGFVVRGDGSGSWPLLDELRVGAWTGVTFENSWKSRTDFEPVRYRTVGKNRVELTGYADAGTANAVMFTLPSGARPKFHKSFPVICQTRNTGAASTGTAHTHPMADIGLRLMVAADGTVRTANAASGWVCLSGVLINLD